jgi:hypothetical protein
MPPSSKFIASALLALLLAVMVSACSDPDTFARRDTIVPSGGNAVASDEISQMVDPWPRAAADQNIAFNGQKMQSAVERYRENKVIAPVGSDTTNNYTAPSPQAPGTATQPAPVGPTVTSTN